MTYIKQLCHFCNEPTLDISCQCLSCTNLFSLYRVITYNSFKTAYIYPLDNNACFYFNLDNNITYLYKTGSGSRYDIITKPITPSNALSKLKFYLSFK